MISFRQLLSLMLFAIIAFDTLSFRRFRHFLHSLPLRLLPFSPLIFFHYLADFRHQPIIFIIDY
jgi:hypothetical protein